MSAGQRHQPFLALRLDSLERHFATGEPMPFVLDGNWMSMETR